MFRRSFVFVTAMLALAVSVSSSFAQVGTEFTYQGKLENLGAVVTSPTDMRFSLWSAASAGSAIGSTVELLALPVSSGLFTASLDFGVNPYTSNQALWLQIEVRNPAGTGSYVPMASRQKLTATPFSLATRGIAVDGAGNVDIGATARLFNANTSSTASQLTIESNSNFGAQTFSAIQFKANAVSSAPDIAGRIMAYYPNNNYVSATMTFQTIGNGPVFVDAMSLRNGNLGIGTTTPSERLHVVGNILATGTITPSCARLKENVVPMGDALERLSALNAVRFDWTAGEAKIRGFTHDLGFIAEDVARAFPEVVFRDENGEIMGLDYSRMSAVAVGAIKELKAENDELKARLSRIEALLAARAQSAGR